MKQIGAVLDDMGWPQRLRELASDIRNNVPDHRNPEVFHTKKSEIEHRALSIADEIERRNRTAAVQRGSR